MNYNNLHHFIDYWKVKLSPFFEESRINELLYGSCTDNLFFSQDKEISNCDFLTVQNIAFFIYGEEKNISDLDANFILGSDFLKVFLSNSNSQLIQNFEILERWAVTSYSSLEELLNKEFFSEKMNKILNIENFSHYDLGRLASDIIQDSDLKNKVCDFLSDDKNDKNIVSDKLKRHLINQIKTPVQLSYYSIKMITENQMLVQSYDQLSSFNLYNSMH